MKVYQIEFVLPLENSEIIADTYLAKGASSVSIKQMSADTVLLTLQSLKKNWFKEQNIKGKLTILRPKDWESKNCFDYLKLTKNIKVFSSHHIQLDTQYAFGDGAHPSTQLCAHYIEHVAHTSKSFLDIGCGTGILSILACKRGIKQVHACDIDLHAVKQSKKNSKLNQCNIYCFQHDIQSQRVIGQYDLITANLLTEILLYSKKNILDALNPKGYLILSGIGIQWAEEIKLTYEENLTLLNMKSKKGWAAFLFQNK